jgi:hypothetical protein
MLANWKVRRDLLTAVSGIAQSLHSGVETFCGNVPESGSPWPEAGWDCTNENYRLIYGDQRCTQHSNLGEGADAAESDNTEFFIDSIKSAASSAFKMVKEKSSSGLKSAGKTIIFKLLDLLPNEFKKLSDLLKKTIEMLSTTGDHKAAVVVFIKGVADAVFKPLAARLVVKALKFAKIPRAAMVYQKMCTNVNEILPRDKYGKIQMNGMTLSPAAMGSPNSEEQPDVFEMYLIRAPQHWFMDTLNNEWGSRCAYPNHKYAPWVPPSAPNQLSGKGCRTTWKNDDPSAPDCTAKVNIKMQLCNTCCCKDGPIKLDVRLTMSHGAAEACAAWFSVTDFVLRSTISGWRGFLALNTYNQRCWRVDAHWSRFPKSSEQPLTLN